MFDAVWTASLWSLNTRREVRGFLARGKNDLTGGPARQDLSAELSDLATGSDREVMDSYGYLDELCKGLSARDATYPRILMTRNVRDLFAKALQRMKDLPPDPRETLHAKAPKTPDVEQPSHISTTGRGVSQPIALRERTARIHVKPARGTHLPPRSAMPATTQLSLDWGNEETVMTHVYTLAAEKSQGKSKTFATQQQTQKAQAPVAVGSTERHHRIAEGAYLRAEHRGFLAGCELQDWLEAEAEVDKPLTQVSWARLVPFGRAAASAATLTKTLLVEWRAPAQARPVLDLERWWCGRSRKVDPNCPGQPQ
jgi:hypothetical protein